MLKLTDRDARFVEQLIDQTEEPEQWRALVAYCLPELLKNQVLLTTILAREAERRAKKALRPTLAWEVMPNLLNDLGLRFQIAPPPPPNP